VVTI